MRKNAKAKSLVSKTVFKILWILGRVQSEGNETLRTICLYFTTCTVKHKAHQALNSLEHNEHTLGHEISFP